MVACLCIKLDVIRRPESESEVARSKQSGLNTELDGQTPGVVQHPLVAKLQVQPRLQNEMWMQM